MPLGSMDGLGQGGGIIGVRFGDMDDGRLDWKGIWSGWEKHTAC